MTRGRNVANKELIIDALTEKANGMHGTANDMASAHEYPSQILDITGFVGYSVNLAGLPPPLHPGALSGALWINYRRRLMRHTNATLRELDGQNWEIECARRIVQCQVEVEVLTDTTNGRPEDLGQAVPSP